MGYEVLTAACVGAGQGHADGAALVAMTIHLVTNGIAGTTVSIISRISILRHEVGDDAVKARVPIVSRPRERKKVPDGDRRVGGEQLQSYRTAHGVDGRVD